ISTRCSVQWSTACRARCWSTGWRFFSHPATLRASCWRNHLAWPRPAALISAFLRYRARKWKPAICSSTIPTLCRGKRPRPRTRSPRFDLNYYIPCRAQRTIAFLGLGKPVEGDFLSSEDIELLETLAGYIAIAIQNARLYASLEQKVAEYERL